MKVSALAINIFAAVGIIVVGVVLGGFGRYAYELYQEREESAPGGEVVNAKGETFTVLAYQPDSPEKREAARQTLKRAGIFSQTVEEKIMVYPAEAALALDCLGAAGLVPGTEHFTFVEVTADPTTEPRRYEYQQLLAAKNTLAKMFPTMSAAVEDAQVIVDDQPGAARTARIVLTLKPGGKLDHESARDMIHHAADLLPGVKASGVKIVDSEGGMLAEYVPATGVAKPAANQASGQGSPVQGPLK